LDSTIRKRENNLNEITKDFYSGYEGEPEIQFVKVSVNGDHKIIRIWSGYFDDIMAQFVPSQQGWSGLAYYYHLAIGWYEESPWQITHLDEIKTQFCNLSIENCRFDKSRAVYKEICDLLREAIENNESVLIAEE